MARPALRPLLPAVFIVFFLTIPVYGQRISLDVGVNAGVPLAKGVQDDAIRPSFGAVQTNVERPQFVLGPAVQLNVGGRFAVEVDGFYRPVRFQTQQTDSHITRTESTHATSLELPIFANFPFKLRKLRSFAGAGFIVYDRLLGTTDVHSILHDQGDRVVHVVTHYGPIDSASSSPPFLAGGGFEFTSGPFTLAPQFRYTRWIGEPVRKPNQWDILVGISLPAFHLRQ
jgi:hypothetical protein